MTDAERDLFGFVGAAFATMIGLFVLQEWYGTFVDVRAHASFAAAGANPDVAKVRAAEAQKLASARVPLDRAMQDLATRGRARPDAVAPKHSDDLSAMSGWIHRPRFQAYVPRAAPAPKAEQEAPAPEPAEAAPPSEPEKGPE
jgi:hypothetical protein